MGSLGCDLIDGVREHRVGEERLLEVSDVVDDDVGATLALLVRQLADVVGEVEYPGVSSGEAELGAGSDVVRDLQHRSTLVDGTLVALEVLDHLDRLGVAPVAPAGQVTGGDVLPCVDRQWVAGGGQRGIVVGVRQGTDGDSGAVDAPCVRLVGKLQGHALARGSAHAGLRLERLDEGAGVRQRRQVAGSGQRHEALDGALVLVDRLDQHVERLDLLAVGRPVGIGLGSDVHQDPVLGVADRQALLVDAESALPRALERRALGLGEQPAETVSERWV